MTCCCFYVMVVVCGDGRQGTRKPVAFFNIAQIMHKITAPLYLHALKKLHV